MTIRQQFLARFQYLRRYGMYGVINILARKGVPVPFAKEAAWHIGSSSEIDFWNSYFRTQGLRWQDNYQFRLDPNAPLQERVVAHLPNQVSIKILDVGAGPLTSLGKCTPGKEISIVAVDPLAYEYDRILARYNITPPVRTQPAPGEELTLRFPANSFDLCYARNALDHSTHPERAIAQMITLTKMGCFVLLEHRANEAIEQNYGGLHQWNFSTNENGDFLISSKTATLNFSEKYRHFAKISCEIVQDGDIENCLIVSIQKI